MNKFHSFMNELEIEELLNDRKYDSALELLLEALKSKNYINKEQLLNNITFCYLQKGEFKRAKIYLKEMLEINPENMGAKYNLALADYSLGDYKNAVKLFESVSIKDGMTNEIAFYMGMCYIQVRQIEKADDVFNFLLKGKISPDLIYSIGISMVSAGYPREAKQVFIKYLDKAQNDIDATFGLGIAYIELKEFRKAIECFDRVIQWDEKRYPSATIMLGVAFYQIGELEKAIEKIYKAIDFEPKSVEAWYYLGVIYDASAQEEKAIHALKRAAEFGEGMPEIWEKLGVIFLEQKKTDEALESYKRAYILTNDSFYAKKIGLIFISQENYQSALDYLTLCLDDGGEQDIYENIGFCYYYLGKYEDCIYYLTRVHEDERHRDLFYFILGSSYMKAGELEMAEEYLNKGLQINSADVNLLYTLGLLKANTEDYKMAGRILEKALIIKRSPEILYALALAKMKLGDNESAVTLFEEYKLFHQSDTEVLYKLGLLYTQMKRFSEAKVAFQEVLSVHPEDIKAREYLQELNKI